MEQEEPVSANVGSSLHLTRPQIEQIILTCNKSAMDLLKAGSLSLAFDLLKKAERLIHFEGHRFQSERDKDKLLSLTLNNLGCYYKK